MTAHGRAALGSLELKSCCAAAYGSGWGRLLLGADLHPGGPALTQRLGDLLALRPEATVLDVACGSGSSAVRLVDRFGVRVVGLDAAADQIAAAHDAVRVADLTGRVGLILGDGEELPLRDAAIDAAISECSLCLMPDQQAALREVARVLRPGGGLGIADIVVRGQLPAELDSLAAWLACLGSARSLPEYERLLADSGFTQIEVEAQDQALQDLVQRARLGLAAVEVAARLGRLDLGPRERETAHALARAAANAVHDGTLGYVLVTAVRAPD
jgi:arsenite methyltransferase